MIGQKVLGYRVEELIGRGSFATVYKVKKENESGTYVRALKRIIIPDEEQYRRIWNAMGHDKRKTDLYFQNVFEETMQEIQLMHAFTENGVKNVVACYENDVIRHMDPIQYEIYILMEYLTPLSDYICNHDLNVEELIDIGVQILDALEVCHANHIIHRDIKEANIFVTPNGIYKLGDFGVAAIQNEQRFVSSIKGTAGYMAPEVYHKSEKYDESVDLYSLGIVLYKLGNHMRSPFMPAYPQEFNSQDSRNALLKRMSEAPVPLPDAIPKNLGRVILKALETQNLLEEPHCKVVSGTSGSDHHVIFLSGGSGRDKALFAQCVNDFFDAVDNQRYLLVSPKRFRGLNGFYVVPECFSKRKEDAQLFAKCMKPYIGAYDVVYTRNEKGRAILLEGKIKALANREERCIRRKKLNG